MISSRRVAFGAGVLGFACWLVAPRLVHAEVRYTITDLLTAGPGESLGAADINDLGQVTGNVYRVESGINAAHPFLWLPAPAYGLPAGFNSMPGLPGYQSTDFGSLNNLGQIVGSAFSIAGMSACVTWLPAPRNGFPAGISQLGANVQGGVAGVNDNGWMAGHYHNAEAAFVWVPAAQAGLPAGMTLLPTPGWGFAGGINDQGVVTGNSFDAAATAFVWYPSDGAMSKGYHSLGKFPGDESTQPNGINHDGLVIGNSSHTKQNGITDQRAFVWLPQAAYGLPAGYSDLGGHDGANNFHGWASDINDPSSDEGLRIIGSISRDGQGFPFLWQPGVGIQNLNSLIDPNSGWVLQSAGAMNANGQIVGSGLHNGARHLFLLDLPEPNALLCAGISAVWLACRRLRRPLDDHRVLSARWD